MKAYLSLWHGIVQGGRPATMSQIVRDVAQDRSIALERIMGAEKTKEVSAARAEAMWAIRQLEREDGRRLWSFQAIGRFFNRDHSSVLVACQQHARRLARA